MDLISLIDLQWFSVVKKLADTFFQFNVDLDMQLDIPLPVMEQGLNSLLST
jgi:hypothetical protein